MGPRWSSYPAGALARRFGDNKSIALQQLIVSLHSILGRKENRQRRQAATHRKHARRIYMLCWNDLGCGALFSLDGRKAFRTSPLMSSGTARKISKELSWWMQPFPMALMAWL